MGEYMGVQGFMGKSERKKHFGRTNYRWDDNIENDI
jgi:hypothetical protein